MRLFEIEQYTDSSVGGSSDDAVAQFILDYIKEHAQPWINEIKENFSKKVYRGIDRQYKDSPPAFVKNIRTDRRPRDTLPYRHDAFNAMLSAAGAVANRSNSAFTTSIFADAKLYGTPFVFIPLGNFNYTYALAWKDWAEDVNVNSIYYMLKDEVREKLPPLQKWYDSTLEVEHVIADPNSYDQKKINQRIKHDKDLNSAINAEVEIMIAAKAGLYIKPQMYEMIASKMPPPNPSL